MKEMSVVCKRFAKGKENPCEPIDVERLLIGKEQQSKRVDEWEVRLILRYMEVKQNLRHKKSIGNEKHYNKGEMKSNENDSNLGNWKRADDWEVSRSLRRVKKWNM
jgi:hypothetical protein